MDSDYRPKRATLNDVAAAAGVSYQTVSRVINGSLQVSAATRSRVQHAIDTLGFYPNRAAQALAKRRTFTLEVIVSRFDYFGPAQMLTSIERAAKLRGYKTMFSTTEHGAADELQALADSLGGLVDGVIMIVPVIDSDSLQPTALHGLPILQVGNRLGDPLPSVVIDQAQGSALATQHLIDRGHRRIAEISGPLYWHEAAERHRGWQLTMQQHGLTDDLFASGDWSAQSGYQAAQQLLASGIAFSGLIAGNDQMALGAIKALRQRGLGIPGDVSIVGFDDLPEASYFDPPLTTIRQDFATMGAQSVEYVIQLIESPKTPRVQHVLHPTLIARASTRQIGAS